MKKIGIYLQLKPDANFATEGLGHVYSQILKGLTTSDFQVTILYPFWLKEALDKLIYTQDIPSTSITLKTIELPKIIELPKTTAAIEKIALRRKIIPFLKRITPISVKSFIKKLFHKLLARRAATRAENIPININGSLVHINNYFTSLVDYANQNNLADIWLISSFTHSQGLRLNGKLFVLFPDCVDANSPSILNKYISRWVNTNEPVFQANMHNLAGTISFNQDVQQQHAIKHFGVSPEKTHVVKHSVIRNDRVLQKINNDTEPTTNYIIQQFVQQNSHRPELRWLMNPGTLYFIYTSQDRPHKNIIHLVSAYEKVLREFNLSCKLVLTTLPEDETPLSKHIQERRLDLDVTRLGHVDATTLAAFYARAHCAINPSLFEGGFPFTFSEALSVNTPCIMSDIACVREEIEDAKTRAAMLFNPESISDITDAMIRTFTQREQLLALQQPIYEKLKQRADADVVNDYARIFKMHV